MAAAPWISPRAWKGQGAGRTLGSAGPPTAARLLALTSRLRMAHGRPKPVVVIGMAASPGQTFVAPSSWPGFPDNHEARTAYRRSKRGPPLGGESGQPGPADDHARYEQGVTP